MKKITGMLLMLLVAVFARGQGSDGVQRPLRERVYVFDIDEEIAPPVNRRMQRAFADARERGAGLIVLHMNTYGGMVTDADSMRTRILNSKIPVVVFIDNNAASAGALISIACEKIYMRGSATIGAATVVNQNAEAMPDKYQSYMRAQMRATAEARGRDPKIAEAMVDQDLYVKGVSDSGKVLTLTTSEAMRLGFCDGVAETVDEVVKAYGIEDYEIIRQEIKPVDRIIDFLINPFVHGILIMLIIGGLYFELQSPGVGFPGLAALIGAVLLFTPLFIEGLAENWEIAVFAVGIVLILVEIFAIPGFGVTGVLGIIFMITGLTLSLLGNVNFDFSPVPLEAVGKAFLLVVVSIFLGLLIGYQGVRLIFGQHRFSLALQATQPRGEGFVAATFDLSSLKGKEGTAFTMLRPAGKVEIDDEIYDAVTHEAFIEKGEKVKVRGAVNTQLVVEKI